MLIHHFQQLLLIATITLLTITLYRIRIHVNRNWNDYNTDFSQKGKGLHERSPILWLVPQLVRVYYYHWLDNHISLQSRLLGYTIAKVRITTFHPIIEYFIAY